MFHIDLPLARRRKVTAASVMSLTCMLVAGQAAGAADNLFSATESRQSSASGSGSALRSTSAMNLTSAGDSSSSRRPHSGEVIVIDMDEEVLVAEPPAGKVVWREVHSAPGLSHIAAGSEFPIVSVSQISSKFARVGDPVEARLKDDLIINGKVIAGKGARITGHIDAVFPARRLLVAEIKLNRWMRANGSLRLKFDQIITASGKRIPLNAVPAQRSRIVQNKNEGRILGVNHDGQIASPLSIQLKHQGTHLAIRGAAAVGGVFTMGAVPVVFGTLGAIDPSFAFMQPVGKNVHHRRLKGFGMGVLSGLPGGFIVADYLIKGVEAEIKPGDQFLVAFQEDFTGKSSVDAQLIEAPHTRLRGEILQRSSKRSKRFIAPSDAPPSAPVSLGDADDSTELTF